jgi:hypothetical protein
MYRRPPPLRSPSDPALESMLASRSEHLSQELARVRAEFESVSRSLTSARSSIDARDKEIARLGRMLADAGGRSIAAMADDGGEGPALVEAKNIIVDVCVNAGLWWEPMLVMWHSPICDFLIFCGQKKKKKKKKNVHWRDDSPPPPQP